MLSPVVKVTAVSVSFGGANETEQCLFVPHANRTCAAERAPPNPLEAYAALLRSYDERSALPAPTAHRVPFD